MVLPCEDQHLHNAAFCYENMRYASFHQHPPAQGWVSQMAKDGYYVQTDAVMCFACGSHYPDHTQICSRKNENIPFHHFPPLPQTTAPTDLIALNVTLTPQTDEDVLRPFNVRSRRRQRSESVLDLNLQACHPNQERQRAVPCARMTRRSGQSHPEFSCRQCRQGSFMLMPDLHQFSQDFADCGFFAMNTQLMVCWACGVQIPIEDLIFRLLGLHQSASSVEHI